MERALMKTQHWAILLALLALAVWLLSLVLRKRSGFAAGRGLLRGQPVLEKPPKALYDASLGLVGSPIISFGEKMVH